jgi:hypothetical protein
VAWRGIGAALGAGGRVRTSDTGGVNAVLYR